MVLGILVSFAIGIFVGFMVFAILNVAKEANTSSENGQIKPIQSENPEDTE